MDINIHKDMDMHHGHELGHAADTWPFHAAWTCYAAFPSSYCVSMSMLRVHVHTTNQWPCCMACPCCMSMYILFIYIYVYDAYDRVHAAWHAQPACLCLWSLSMPCCMFISMMNTDIGTDTYTRTWTCSMDVSMQHGHGHAAWKWTRSINIDEQHIAYVSMLHFPCSYCKLMSILHVRVHATYMSMSMLHFLVLSAFPCLCCILSPCSMSILFSPQIC
jgi:hypothetical protein